MSEHVWEIPPLFPALCICLRLVKLVERIDMELEAESYWTEPDPMGDSHWTGPGSEADCHWTGPGSEGEGQSRDWT